MDLVLRRSVVGGAHVLIVAGDIDLPALPRLSDALLRLVADSPGGTIVVDLDGAGLVDDAALGLLLGAAGRARGAGGELTVVSTDQRTRSRLRDTGFDRAVEVRDSITGG